jgi:hypothetical protein
LKVFFDYGPNSRKEGRKTGIPVSATAFGSSIVGHFMTKKATNDWRHKQTVFSYNG